MPTTTRLLLPYILTGQAQKEVSYNTALALLDVYVQSEVLDVTLTSPPGSPSTGDRYVVGVGATGAWAGKDNHVMHWNGTMWEDRGMFNGMLVFNADTDKFWVYYANTSPPAWEELSINSTRYIIGCAIDDKPAASQKCVIHAFTGSVTFPVGLNTSKFYADVIATASSVFKIYKYEYGGSPASVEIGSITFGTSSNWGTASFTNAVTFLEDDVMVVVAPTSQDTTLADVGLSIRGVASGD